MEIIKIVFLIIIKCMPLPNHVKSVHFNPFTSKLFY